MALMEYWDEELREKCLYGELSYANYKSKDLIAISERLENDRENVLSDLPVFYTIEGNTGDPGLVRKRERDITSDEIIAYGSWYK